MAVKKTDKIHVRVYVKHGYYQYNVGSVAQAVDHAEQIMRSQTYRTAIDGGMEVYHVEKVKLVGPGLESHYRDEFCRT